MTPENPEALITIIIAGFGYGIYIGGESIEKRRLAKPDQYHLPQMITLLARYGGGAMMILSVAIYVFSWATSKF
tara:strand:- start:282 stop:503 length:222 start_codon:yes stop_codon:yes gene_type:complete